MIPFGFHAVPLSGSLLAAKSLCHFSRCAPGALAHSAKASDRIRVSVRSALLANKKRRGRALMDSMQHASTELDEPRPLTAPSATLAARPKVPEFKRIVSEYGPYVFGLLRRLGVAQADLDDAAQEVFLVVHRALPGFEGRSRVRTWLVGICLRVVAHYRRQCGRRREVPAPHAAEPHVDAARTPDVQERAELRRSLERALWQLPEDQRAVVVLFEVEEMSMKEVAQALNVPKFTAYTRLYAARRKLKALLAEEGVRP